jgi:hypothetical protein
MDWKLFGPLELGYWQPAPFLEATNRRAPRGPFFFPVLGLPAPNAAVELKNDSGFLHRGRAGDGMASIGRTEVASGSARPVAALAP